MRLKQVFELVLSLIVMRRGSSMVKDCICVCKYRVRSRYLR